MQEDSYLTCIAPTDSTPSTWMNSQDEGSLGKKVRTKNDTNPNSTNCLKEKCLRSRRLTQCRSTGLRPRTQTVTTATSWDTLPGTAVNQRNLRTNSLPSQKPKLN